jgi:phosphate transport system protein
VFKELLNLFGPRNPFEAIQGTFMSAFRDAVDVFGKAHVAVWSGDASEATSSVIYETDVKVNQGEREVRKMVVRHLSVQQGLDIIYCLRLMSVVKDVERIGDYGKNLFEVAALRDGAPQLGKLTDELRVQADWTWAYVQEAADIFDAGDEVRANTRIAEGRQALKDGDRLVGKIVRSDMGTNAACCDLLMARYYKRAVGHATNILTGLTMPIHKLDYFDELHE